MVHAEIITIGDELLIGQIVNTNAAYLGRELGSAGIPVLRETTVGDDAQRLLAEFRRAWKASDVRRYFESRRGKIFSRADGDPPAYAPRRPRALRKIGLQNDA